jgi:hypothetical protein
MSRDGSLSNRVYSNAGYRTIVFGNTASTTDPSGRWINSVSLDPKKHDIIDGHTHNIAAEAARQEAENKAASNDDKTMGAFTEPLNI